MSARQIHMRLDIKGALTNWKKSNFKKMFKKEDGAFMSADEAKRALLDYLSEGKLYIPFGDCEGFDYVKGCPGHEVKP